MFCMFPSLILQKSSLDYRKLFILYVFVITSRKAGNSLVTHVSFQDVMRNIPFYNATMSPFWEQQIFQFDKIFRKLEEIFPVVCLDSLSQGNTIIFLSSYTARSLSFLSNKTKRSGRCVNNKSNITTRYVTDKVG